MEYSESPINIEFLDLSDVEEQERNHVLSSLYSWDPNVQLPWKTTLCQNNDGYNHQNVVVRALKTKDPKQIYQAPGTYPPFSGQGEPHHKPPPVYDNQPHTHTTHTDADFVDCTPQNIASVTISPTKPVAFTEDVEVVPSSLVQNGDAAVSPRNKSWASLFNKSGGESDAKVDAVKNGYSKPLVVAPSVVNVAKEDDSEASAKESLRAKYDDPHFYRMGEFLESHTIDNRITSLQPRGLINRSNYCYINSILQALLACPPMYNLLSGLAKNITNEKDNIPIINGLSRLIKEFHHLPAGQRVGRRSDKTQKKEHTVSINCDAPFEPAWIYKMLTGMRSDSFVVEGRQEDAEEFLGCLLDGLNDEMMDLIKLVCGTTTKSYSSDSGDADKEWQVMGPKNKGSITRRTDFGHSPISDIFGGLLRSRVVRTGDHYTDNIQPFFTLQLNIENVTTVKEALDALVTKNKLEGVTSSTTNEEVEAWQQVTIEELPIVLVLHLKCFDFKLDGCTKIVKALEFPIDLKIESKLLSLSSKTTSSARDRQYKLFAVVYHDGKEATKGHYVTDAYHVGYASWLRYDDASVKAVQEEHVLKPQGTRVPYLLFYRRSDSIKVSK